MQRIPITISIEQEIVNEIDSVKGRNEPRSRFIEDIVSDYLNNSGKKSQRQSTKTIKSGDIQ